MKLNAAAMVGATIALTIGLVGAAPGGAGAATAQKINISVNHTTMHPGSTSRLSGTVAPKLAGHKMYLQRHYSSGWRSISMHRLDSKSSYVFHVKSARVGTFTFRTYSPASAVADLPSAHSRTVTVKFVKVAQQSCTAGYSPCIAPGSDVDCAGGSGNGPRYVTGPVRVYGSDPYELDRDGDGVACET